MSLKPRQSSELFKFLNDKNQKSKEGPVSKTDFFNSTTVHNQRFSSLFTGSGFLNSKERRSALFELMKQNGASVEDGNVVFAPDFSSHIDGIVSHFFPEKESKPLKHGKGSCCGAAVSSCQQIESQSSKHVRGGAVCHKRPNSDPITLSEFQESTSRYSNETCLVCANTNNDGSGTCKFKNCDFSHPQNPTSVVVQKQKTSKRTILVANVCSHFQNGTCKYEGKCRNAHISKEEYAMVVERNRMHREKKIAGTQVSSEKPKTPAVIVPSQVRLERHSHSSAHSTGLSRVAAELQDLAFQDSDALFEKWLGFTLGGEHASAAVSSTPRSYSPAVEVSDSDDEKGDQ
jgi:hypothetical protein